MDQQTLNLEINTGELRLAINGDPSRIIVFNPTDVEFVSRFMKLIEEYQVKLIDFQKRYNELQRSDDAIAGSQDVAFSQDRAALMLEFCKYTRNQIDAIFGTGTSQTAFGDAMKIEMFPQFFTGLMKYVDVVRKDLITQYLPGTGPAKRPIAAATRRAKGKKSGRK